MNQNHSKLVKSIILVGAIGLIPFVSGCKDKSKRYLPVEPIYQYETNCAELSRSLEGKTPTFRKLLHQQEGTEYKSHNYIQ